MPTNMPTNIFVNVPVQDLDRSIAFFASIGYTFNPQFTNEKAACMIISDTIYVMLLTESFFSTFTKKSIADANTTTEVIVALSVESREKVDEIINKAVAAGGTEYRDSEDHGWMYSRAFQDLDGHQWEYIYMDITQAPPTPVTVDAHQ
jgi:predicted lactoylglutathione lyase